MPPIKFRLNLTYGLGEMSFEEFQHGPHGSHLGYQNGSILAILNLCVTVIPLCHCDAAILDIGTELFLAVLNLYVAPMPPIKFRLNLTYPLGGDVV